MKNFIILPLLAIFLISSSCTKKDASEDITTQPPTDLNGVWSLTKITGGFAGVNDSFFGSVFYNFNSSNNVLTVNNNYIGVGLINKGLLTGSYPFSLSGNQININSEVGIYTINENKMVIDQNEAADGFAYTFERILPTINTQDQCLSYSQSFVISATVPTTGFVNNPIQIPIKFSVNNGCGGFGNITETNSGNTKTLTVNAKYLGCICTQVIGEITTTFNFIPTTIGNQIIKISQPDGSFLTYNINITN